MLSTKTLTASAQYSITVRLECPHEPGWIARIASLVAKHGGAIRAIDLVHIHRSRSLRDYTIDCASADMEQTMIDQIKSIEGVSIVSVSDETFRMHLGGKLEIQSKVPLETRADLSMAYTPGVARVCTAIAEDPRTSFNLTIRKNTIAVVSDGSAVLGLGDIGPEAAMPVMEGKAILFKKFGGVDAFPLCVRSKDPGEIVRFCEMIAPSFGGINLEDISAPRCFAIERELQERLEIPVFHDDQHGTAVVVLAAMINALKITRKSPETSKLVISGAGAAAYACARILHDFGFRNMVVCDRQGAIHPRREFPDNPAKRWFAAATNPGQQSGSLLDVLAGSDIFLGLSGPGILNRADVQTMNPEPIIFAMANPTPEVMPEEIEGIASVVATGRSDFPNQVNNVLAFPGIFRGALDSRASEINSEMKLAAARAIASLVPPEELQEDYIVPSAFHRRVAREVARAVSQAAHKTGVAHRRPKGLKLHV